MTLLNVRSRLKRLLQNTTKPKAVPISLQEAIDNCQTTAELKTLLLSKEVVLDEQMTAAFDKRIAQLEEQTGKPFLF